MQRSIPTIKPATGGTLCPDLATLTKRMYDAGIPLLGVSLTPSFNTLPRSAAVTKPSIGLVKRTDVEALLVAVGLPLDGYLPGARNEQDAFRLAIQAIIEDRDFKRSGYFLREDKKAPAKHIRWVVVEERARDENAKSIEYGSAQYIYFDRDTRRVNFDRRDGHRIVTPNGLIQPNLIDWWNKFLEHMTTEDVSHMVANYLRYHCGGVPMRKGGGTYFMPKTQDAWPLNGELALIQDFCERLKGLGEIGVRWTDLPVVDAESVRANMTHHVTQEIGGQANKVRGDVKTLLKEVETKGRKLRSATGDAKIAELQALENRCALYEQIGLSDIAKLREKVKEIRLEIKAELQGAAKGEGGETLADILAGLAGDVLGEGKPSTTKEGKPERAARSGRGSKIEPGAFQTNGNGKEAPAEEEESLDELLAQLTGASA